MLEITHRHHIVYITLNRPDCRNALDDVLMEQLTSALHNTQFARVCVLKAKGPDFCSGAHLDWMKSIQDDPEKADSKHLETLLRTFDTLPLTTVTVVQGSAFGGALGLIAASDIVLAEQNAQFCLSEVKLGLIPALIAPYVARAIGIRRLRHLALTATKFHAQQALQYGLVHEVCTTEELLERESKWCEQLGKHGPQALLATKELCQQLDTMNTDDNHQYCLDTITRIRASSEAQEGIRAFFEKRKPAWALE